MRSSFPSVAANIRASSSDGAPFSCGFERHMVSRQTVWVSLVHARSMRTVLAVFLLLVLGSTPPVAADEGASLPLLLQDTMPLSGWISFRLESDGSPLFFEMMSPSTSGGSHMAWMVYDAHDKLLGGITFSGVTEMSGHMVDVHPIDGVDVSETSWNPSQWGRGTSGVTLNTALAPGSYKILLAMVADMDDWRYTVRGGGATTLGEPLVGDGAWFFTSRNFEGKANVQAFAEGRHTAAFGGRVEVETTRTITVEHAFVGIFLGGLGSDRLAYEVDGVTRACPCGFAGVAPEKAVAGEITFHLTGAGAGMRGMSEILLVGVDARLPP